MKASKRPPADSSPSPTPAPLMGGPVDERLMSAILKSSLSAITALDGDGCIVFANAAAERLLRLEATALAGQRYDSPRWQLRTLDGRPLAPAEMPYRRVRDRGEVLDDQRYQLIHADGDICVMELRGLPLRDDAGEFRLAVFGLEDVSDEAAATEELRRTHELYRDAIQNAGAMVYQLHLASGRYEILSPGMAELLGKPAGECSQADWATLKARSSLITALVGADHAATKTAFLEGRLPHLEYEIEVVDSRTGRQRWFRDSSMPVRVPGLGRVERSIGLLVEVTGMREAELRLATTHDLYRQAIRNAQAMLYVLDIKTRRYESVSPEFAALLGRPADDCVLDDWSRRVEEATLVHPPPGVTTENVWEKIQEGGIDRIEYECRVCDAKGDRRRWFRDVTMPLRDADTGRADRILGLLFDITEVREARDRLAETHDLYRSAIHNANSMFYVFNLETLAYDMTSPEFAAMLGKRNRTCTLADWEAAVSDFKVIHPVAEQAPPNLVQAMRAGKLDRVEFEVVVRDARTEAVRCFRDYAMPIREPGGGPVRRTLGLLVDITPQHAAQKQLQAIHDIYRKAIQNANAMLYVLNYRTGLYEMATPEFERLLGKPLGQCAKADWVALVQSSELVNVPPGVHAGNVEEMLFSGAIDRVEFEVRILDATTGQERWFRDASMLLKDKGKARADRCLGLLIDVTQVHDAQAQLLDVHDIYRQTIANANGIPYLLNMRSRMYDYFGPGIRTILGDVPTPVPIDLLYHRVVDKRIVESAPGQQSKHDDARFIGEVKVLCNDGRTRWYLDTSMPIRDSATGEVTGSLGILQDIDDRVREREVDEALGRMTQRLSGARTPRDAAVIVLEAADGLLDWDMGFLLTYDQSDDEAVLVAVVDRDEAGKREFDVAGAHAPGPPGPGARRAIQRGAYITSADEAVRAGLALVPIGDTKRRSQTLMYVPLLASHGCTGVLSLQSYRPDAFAPAHLALAKRLADAGAAAVARIEAEDDARAAQAQLATAHDIYRRAIANANGIPYLLNFEKQEYEYAGSNIERLLGPVEMPIPRAALLDRIIEARTIEPANMTPEELRVEVQSGRLQRYIAEIHVHCHDGVARWFVDTALPMADPTTGRYRGSLGILQDITDRVHEKEVDTAMATMGARLGAATTPIEVARIALQTADELLGWHAAFVTLQDPNTMARESLLVAGTILDRKVELETDAFLGDTPGPAYLRCVLEGGFVLNMPPDDEEGAEHLTRFGDIGRPSRSLLFVPLQTNQQVIGVLSIQSYTVGAYDERSLRVMKRLALSCSAAIARTQTAEKLRETESRLLALAESSPGVIYQFIVSPEGMRRLTYVSPSVIEMWGLAPEAFYGHPMRVLERIDPEDQRVAIEQFDHAVVTRQPYSILFRLHHTSGELRWVRAQARPGPARPDGSLPWSGLMSDVTSLRDAEDKRRRLDEEIQRLDKLESLGLLAGGVAHDFNNLLSGVVANATMALADLPPDHSATPAIRQIEAAALRMSELSHQMLAYSGRGRFENKAFDLSQMATETLQLLRSTIPTNIVVHIATAAEPLRSAGDPMQIRQIIMNLVANAREAIGDVPGTIAIRTERRVLSSLEELPAVPWRDEIRPGAFVALVVEDTGRGMDAPTMKRIFEPFFSTKFTGRGLGLAAAQGILRAHKGVIAANSTVGVGSTFTILLPEAPEGTVVPPARRRTGSTRSTTIDATILVVDDEAAVRQVLEAILRRAGMRFLSFADGASALAHVTSTNERFDAVLLDMTMPGMGGAEFHKRLHALRPRVPIVLMSGYSEQEVTAAFSDGALAGFISKPFKPADVVGLLTRAIAQSQTPTGESR